MINGFKSYKRIWSGPVIPCLFQSCCDEMDIVLSMHLVSYPSSRNALLFVKPGTKSSGMHPPPTKKQNLHMLVVLFDRIRRTKPLTGCHYSHYSLSLLAGFLFSLLQFPHPPAPTQTLSLTLSNSVLLPSTLSLTGSLPGCLLQSSNTAAFSST